MSDTAAHDHSNWKPKSNPWLIAVVVTLAAFMEVLDTTIVNVALPHLRHHVRELRRSHVDAHVLSRRERHRAAAVRLLLEDPRAQALLPDLHRGVHRVFVSVRHRDESRAAHHLPHSAGLFRRRFAAEPAVDHSRYLPARAARPRVFDLGGGDRRGARSPGRRSAAGSPTTSPGAGSFCSTCRLAC